MFFICKCKIGHDFAIYKGKINNIKNYQYYFKVSHFDYYGFVMISALPKA
jgi:hypothetical protein